MAAKQIYLIRHALPDYPRGAKMCLGQKNDLPLSAAGLEQAQRLGAFFAALPLEAVYTSPLLRARQTAALVAGGRPLVVLHDLIELYGGEWDGLPFEEIHARYPQYFGRGASFSCPPGGESDAQGLARARAALAYADAHTKGCAAIVAHSGINRLLLCDLLGRPLVERRQIAHDYAAVCLLEGSGSSWRVRDVCISR
ncbi:MAG: histidine phosphatase family protein [Candidatus Ventricola sp.]